MFSTLAPGAIGIRDIGLEQAIDLARASGFAGLVFNIREAANLADEHGVDHVSRLFAQANVRPAYWGLPASLRDEDRWRTDVQNLPRFAELGRALGCTRVTAGVAPGSDERSFDANLAWHVERFRPIAAALAAEDCRLGIEFIGPKTSRARFRYQFIYTLGGVMEMAARIGVGNVGVLLDAWHLYTAGGSLDDLDTVTADDIVAVHVNDAPPGIPVDEQIDTVRTQPLETGVIDLVGFMTRLRAMGYDGPVMPEPFSQRVDDLAATDPLAAARETAASMHTLWKAANLV